MPYTLNWDERMYYPRVGQSSQAGAPSDFGVWRTYTQTKSGERMLDWKERIKSGIQAGSPFSCDRNRVTVAAPGHIIVTYKETVWPFRDLVHTGRGFAFSPVPGNVVHLTVSQAEAEAIALRKTYEKIRQEQQTMNGSAVVAEFGDVLRQFGAPAEAIVGVINAHLDRVRRGSRLARGSRSMRERTFLDVVSSSWLEASFGLMPLISDTKSASEALARWNLEGKVTGVDTPYDPDRPELRKPRSRISSSGSSTAVSLIPGSSSSFSPTWIFGYGNQKTETECSVRYTVGLNQSVMAAYGSNERLLQILGFTPDNWVPALWEAVPWSWLVDYFTNVQEILSAGFTKTSSVTWIVKSVRTKSTHEVSSHWDLPGTVAAASTNKYKIVRIQRGDGNRDYSDSQLGRVTIVRTTLNRTLPSSLGIPPLVFEHPFGSWKKIANMAAVLLARRKSDNFLGRYVQ